MIPTLYRGSVKNLLGPIQTQDGFSSETTEGILFQYSDAYSVFDWGRMPDHLPNKGAALAIMACDFFERLGQPQSWKEFSRSQEALDLRKGVSSLPADASLGASGTREAPVSLGSSFNDLGELLQREGLKTHYLGVVDGKEVLAVETPKTLAAQPLKNISKPFQVMAVRNVSVVRPTVRSVLGKPVLDYHPTRNSKPPRLIPLEVIFRFTCPEGSSLIKRAERNPDYLAGLAVPMVNGKPVTKIEAGTRWGFPLLEVFSKLESFDRPVSLTEALAITGLSAAQLQDVLLKTAWVAGFLKWRAAQAGIELADGKLEWGLLENGECMLVDAMGPDEVRLLKDGVQLSKEFLRSFYRNTSWAEKVERAKKEAPASGISDWKTLVKEEPPHLTAHWIQLASQMYMSLTNAFTGKKWFEEAWDLNHLMGELKKAKTEIEEQAKPPTQAGLFDDGKKKTLVVGSGGREHALAWKLAQSRQVSQVIVSPGNDGMLGIERWPFSFSSNDPADRKKAFEDLAIKAKVEGIDLVVVGPDNPLADGIVDVLQEQGLLVFGPNAQAAKIESSKAFAKDVMKAAGVPTAEFEVVKSYEEAATFLKNADWTRGWVIKADGLALGKGVRVCTDLQDALSAANDLIKISGSLVIEEKLTGQELSWMAICDGNRFVLLDPARDYKTLYDHHKGPNTGGMGAYSPVPEFNTDSFKNLMKERVFGPILQEMKERGCPFRGVLFAGLMVDLKKVETTGEGLWVLEFNARFGDPETQAILPRMSDDLYPWLEAAAKGDLKKLPQEIPFKDEFVTYVVGAAPGYPESPKKDVVVGTWQDHVSQSLQANGMNYFSAGLRRASGSFVTAGGRVLGAVGLGLTLKQARDSAYENLKNVKFEGMQYRKDIGNE